MQRSQLVRKIYIYSKYSIAFPVNSFFLKKLKCRKKIFVKKICSFQHNKEECNKRKEINIFCGYYRYTQLFDISTNKTTEISIKITFKKNTFTQQRTLIIPELNPLKRLHQSYHRNQVNLRTLSCIPIICYINCLGD